ncbi:hypothetical protein P7K49_027877, partial [Saguinus oedipus]
AGLARRRTSKAAGAVRVRSPQLTAFPATSLPSVRPAPRACPGCLSTGTSLCPSARVRV